MRKFSISAAVVAAFLGSPAFAQDAQSFDFQCAVEPAPAANPYDSKFVDVLDGKMHYHEAGDADGPTVLLLHGLPVSAHFWRNVMPAIEDSHHVIALDQIGFGKSSRPDGLTYGIEDHVRYIDAFVKKMGLDEVIVVGQDLGSWSGMTWASQNPSKVAAVALVEGIIPPLLPASTATTDPNLLGIWQAARTPELAKEMFVDGNFFINVVLTQFTACPMAAETLATYAAPWEDPASRSILYATPAELPIDGQPPQLVDAVDTYISWIEETDIPKLLVHATPGALMPAPVIEAAQQNMSNVTTVNVGLGLHFLNETRPAEVSAAVSDWLDSL